MSALQVEAFSSPSDGGFLLLVILAGLVKLAMFAFWIVVVWRALRAHERLPKHLAASVAPVDRTVPGST